MDTLDMIDLFRHEMTNEIYHLVSDEVLRDALIQATNDVSRTVTETYNASKKPAK